MEQDFQQNQTYYTVGLIALTMGEALIAFGLYLIPYLFFNWHYSVPYCISGWRVNLMELYHLSSFRASCTLAFIFLMPGSICVWFTSKISNQGDSIKTNGNVRKVEDTPSAIWLILKIVGLIVITFVIARIFQWMITNS